MLFIGMRPNHTLQRTRRKRRAAERECYTAGHLHRSRSISCSSPRKQDGLVAICEGLYGLSVRLLKAAARAVPSIPLQLIGDAFGVTGQFHVAPSTGGPSLNGAGRLDGAFPISHLRAARGGEFLLGHERNEFQR